MITGQSCLSERAQEKKGDAELKSEKKTICRKGGRGKKKHEVISKAFGLLKNSQTSCDPSLKFADESPEALRLSSRKRRYVEV